MNLTYFGHGGQFKHENLQFSLVNTITHQIIIALGPNLTMYVSQECQFEDG